MKKWLIRCQECGTIDSIEVEKGEGELALSLMSVAAGSHQLSTNKWHSVYAEEEKVAEKVVVSLKIRQTGEYIDGPHEGMVLKGLTFMCLPAEAEKLFKAACQAVEKEKKDGESGSTAKKGGGEPTQSPPTSGQEGPLGPADSFGRRKPRGC